MKKVFLAALVCAIGPAYAPIVRTEWDVALRERRAIAAALAGKEGSAVTVDIDTMRKDLTEMVAEARELGWQAPMTERALECFDHASKQGLGGKDCVMLPVNWSAKPQKL